MCGKIWMWLSILWCEKSFVSNEARMKNNNKKDCVQENNYVYIYKANIQHYYQQETWLQSSKIKSPPQNNSNITTIEKKNSACI